jgi:hypothetical protein
MSYDDALAEPEDLTSLAGEPELSDVELSSPMRDAPILATCGAPDTMKLTLRVVVRDGKAVGVTVRTDPDDATIAECVDKAVRELSWATSKHRDSFTTSY